MARLVLQDQNKRVNLDWWVLVLGGIVLCGNGLGTQRAIAANGAPSLIAQQTENDSTDKANADRLFQEGEQLYKQHSVESLKAALAKLKAAGDLYHRIGNRKSEATTLNNIGKVYDDLGEKQEAIKYYNQSLPLYRVVGDRDGEASTLNNLGSVYSDLGEKQEAIKSYNQSLPLFRAVGDRKGEAVTLNNLGKVYSDLGEKQEAIKSYNQSLPLFRTVGDRKGEAVTLNNLGKVYDDLGEKQEAIKSYNQSLPLFRAVGDRAGEATTLNNLGAVYSNLGEKQEAIKSYNQSLPLFRAVGDRAGEAVTLNNLGAIYDDLGEKQEAIKSYNQSLPLRRAVGNRDGEARTLNNLGEVYSDLGEKQEAIKYLNQSLPLFRAVGDRAGEAVTLNNLGAIYDDLGEKQEAIKSYNQSLPLRRAVGNRDGEARTLNNLGEVYSDLGEKQEAIKYLNQSLPLFRAVGDRAGEAVTLNNLGKVYSDLGEKQKAIESYNQSLPLFRAVGDRAGEASTFNNLGGVYSDLGEKQEAIKYYNQSLPLFRAVGDRAGEAVTLTNLGVVYNDLGEKQEAIKYYHQSLPLSRAVGDRAGEAVTLTNLGVVYNDLGEKQEAIKYYHQSLPLSRAVGDRAGEAVTLNNLGVVYSSLGEKQEAIKYLNQSLPLRRAVGDRADEANTLFNLAYVKRSQGNLQESLILMEDSLHIIEDLRTKIASQDLRTSYFATKQDYYEFYIDLLMELHKQQPTQGYNIKAFEASDRSRARSLIELLTESRAKITTGIDPKLLEQEQDIQNQIDAFEKNSQKILNGNPTPEQKAKLQQEKINLSQQYNNIRDQIRVSSPAYAQLKYPDPLTLADVQKKLLDEHTVLLQYSLGSDRSYLWAVTQTEISSYKLPKQSEIEKLAKEFRYKLTDPATRKLPIEIRRSSQQLSDIIIKPVLEKIGNKRLLIVADGALQYIPFSALNIPGKSTNEYTPLITEHEVINSPSVSTIGIIKSDPKRNKTAPKPLVVFADPVFTPNDERFAKTVAPQASHNISDRGLPIEAQQLEKAALTEGIKWKRLPFTRDEADGIVRIIPNSQPQELLDFRANRQALNSNSHLNQYQIIHLATHGFVDTEHPEFSGILLSLLDQEGNYENGYLTLNDIFNLDLQANLVVLSACQTGVGKLIKGEGLVGLTRGFMYAGTPRVLVSLWSINDQSTSELMVKFYQKTLKEKLTPVAALRAAQLEMWQQGDWKKWKSPYYWAAFTMQGDWN